MGDRVCGKMDEHNKKHRRISGKWINFLATNFILIINCFIMILFLNLIIKFDSSLILWSPNSSSISTKNYKKLSEKIYIKSTKITKKCS